MLVDRPIIYPYGVLEDVLVKVDDLLFPTDFVILDIPEDSKTQLLLGNMFLEIGRALIDMELGELILRVDKKSYLQSVRSYETS